MENKMFCYQCQETAGCKGCTQVGVCGKKPEVAGMQDLLVYVTKGLGAVAWEHLGPRAGADWHDADGWPTCECTACGCCGEPAEAQDEGVAVCAVCADYTVDADGEVVCAGCTDRVERVTESCGAGGQTRTYLRLRAVRQ